jgi:hypothetical protein
MNDPALSMQILQTTENVHQPSHQELFRESMEWYCDKADLENFPIWVFERDIDDLPLDEGW